MDLNQVAAATGLSGFLLAHNMNGIDLLTIISA
jgi:hypothetical protein